MYIWKPILHRFITLIRFILNYNSNEVVHGTPPKSTAVPWKRIRSIWSVLGKRCISPLIVTRNEWAWRESTTLETFETLETLETLESFETNSWTIPAKPFGNYTKTQYARSSDLWSLLEFLWNLCGQRYCRFVPFGSHRLSDRFSRSFHKFEIS